MNNLRESEYDWVKIPTDLNPKNMVMITAKTPHPTFHKGNRKYPVRLFTTQELLEASRSLAHRAIGLNHLGLIEGAFTIDAQYNPSTGNTEALCFFPDGWIDKVRTLLHQGKESIFSISYTWRDERYTESGVEFLGLIFDQVDLLCGVPAGDKYVSARLVESAIELSHRRSCTEADVDFIGAEKLQQSNLKPSNDEAFFKHHKECGCTECHTLKESAGNLEEYQHKKECECSICKKGVESVLPEDKNTNTILFTDNADVGRQRPEETNLLNNEPQQGISNQDPPNVEKPLMNVMSAGFIDDNKGKGPTSVGGTPENGRVDQTMSGNTDKPVIDEHKLVTQQETGVTGSMGAETSNSNPIDEGLNKVDGPMNPKSRSSYIKQESEKLVETETNLKPEPDPKLIEVEKKLSESAIAITTLEAEKHALLSRISELEPVINKLQEAAKIHESSTKLSVEKARKEGKQEIIQRVKKVLPSNSMVSGNLQGCYRVLTNDINKVLHECEVEI